MTGMGPPWTCVGRLGSSSTIVWQAITAAAAAKTASIVGLRMRIPLQELEIP
jgi:hypothetical protein